MKTFSWLRATLRSSLFRPSKRENEKKHLLAKAGALFVRGCNNFDCRVRRPRRSVRIWLIVYVRKLFPFFLSKELQKEPKTAFLEFRLCGGDEGFAPSTRRLLKKAGENFHPARVIRRGKRRKNFHPARVIRRGKRRKNFHECFCLKTFDKRAIICYNTMIKIYNYAQRRDENGYHHGRG